MLLWALSLITPPEIMSIEPASPTSASVEILLPPASFIELLVSIITLPAEPFPKLALDIKLPEFIPNVPRLNWTEPAVANVKDAAEMTPLFCSDKELAKTTTSPLLPLLLCSAAAQTPENKSGPAPLIKSELAVTITSPASPEPKVLAEIPALPPLIVKSLA